MIGLALATGDQEQTNVYEIASIFRVESKKLVFFIERDSDFEIIE